MKRRAACRWVTTVCLTVLTVLAPRTSLAERPPSPPSQAAERPAPSAESSPASTAGDVDAWFREASERFEAGDFAGALPLLERACAGSAFPGCALNLGAVHHALRHCPEARRHYEQYLREEPQGERVAEARAALTELEPHCKSNAAAFGLPEPSTPGAASAVAPSSSSSSSASSSATAASGLAGGAAAVSGSSSLAASASAPLDPPAPAVVAVTAAEGAATSAMGASSEPRRVGAAHDPALEGGTPYRPIAASMLILGGAAGLTTLYLGVRLASANAEFREHRDTAFDDQQRARLERSEQYQALTVGSGVASALLLGAGGVMWWLGGESEGDADVAVGPNGLAGAQLSGRF